MHHTNVVAVVLVVLDVCVCALAALSSPPRVAHSTAVVVAKRRVCLKSWMPSMLRTV